MDKSVEEMMEDFKGIVTSVNPNTDPYARIAALEASLRDCLHLLETSEGLWVTDKPASHTGMLDIGIDGIVPWATRSDGDAMWVAPGLYWQQTFRDTEAVKRARGLVGISPSDPL